MTTTTIAFALGALVTLACIIDAARYNRGEKQTLYRFFLMGGKLDLKGFVGTIVAANLSLGNFIIFITTWGYKYGFEGIIFFIINLCLNVIGFLLLLRHFKPYIENTKNNGTIHDYLASAYGTDPHSAEAARIRLSASVVTIVCLTLAMVFELSLAVSLLHPTSAVGAIYLFGTLAAFIAFFTAYGGFRTLVVSDVTNALILSAGVCALLYFISSNCGSQQASSIASSLMPTGSEHLGWASIVSIIVIGSGWMIVAMDQWQRTCASRSYPVTFNGTLIYLFILSLFAISFAWWGSFDRSVLPTIVGPAKAALLSGSSNPLLDISLLPTTTSLDHGLLILLIVGLVFAGVSTTNTFLNVCSHSLTTDILMSSFAHKELGELSDPQNDLYVGIGRAVIIMLSAALILIFTLLTYFGLLKDPLSFFFITYSVQFALLGPMLFSVRRPARRPSANSALVSIRTGFSLALIFGFGFWWLSQCGVETVLWVKTNDWLTLTPVLTSALGAIPLAFGRKKKVARARTN